jgi:hypothetical protein
MRTPPEQLHQWLTEPDGARMEEFRQVLPALARSEIQVLLRELAAEQAIHKQGVTRAARWYPGAPPPDGSPGQPVANEPG